MEPIDIELKNALTRTQPIPAAELAALNHRIVETFARKQKGFFHLMTAYLVVMTLVMLALLALYMSTSDLKQCLLLGIGILIMFEGTVLMKLWYWTMHGKIATVREIKLLQLAIAELKTHQPSPPQGTAAGFRDESAPVSAPSPTASSSRKWWRIVLVPVWLLAVAGTVYFGWVQNPGEPRQVTPYFEKTFTAADGTKALEWQQSFEVTHARVRFYPRLVAAEKTARVWISVGAEGSEPLYTGPVEPRSRIGFGRATPGRYIVKGRIDKADGDLTLRIGGVNEIPGAPTFDRLFLLMLIAAVAVAIPMFWLQNRWLRHIDPELEK
jgi:hypothetical protein